MQYYSGRVIKPDQTKLGSTKPNKNLSYFWIGIREEKASPFNKDFLARPPTVPSYYLHKHSHQLYLKYPKFRPKRNPITVILHSL